MHRSVQGAASHIMQKQAPHGGQKALLIISGGREAADAARRAKELGFYVIVADRDPEAPAFAVTDSILIADADGADETSAAAERFSRKIRRIDGAICMAANAPMTMAAVARRLGLPSPSERISQLACDKLAMKRALREAGLPVPWFAPVETPQALARIVIEHGRDLVIKPVDSRESRGVQRLAAVADIDRAFALARSHSITGSVMVECCLDGPQLSAQALVLDGHCATPVLFDRNFEYLERYAPFFVQNGGELPSALPAEIQEEVRALVAQAAQALCVTNGAMKADIIVHDGNAQLIDLATTICGGAVCTHAIPLSSGVDFIGAAIRLAVGDAVPIQELEPRDATPVVQRYLFPQPGRVVSISGIEAAREIPGITDVIITAQPGDVFPRSNDRRPSAAMVLATGTTRDVALSAAKEALARIHIVIEPTG
ncbi:MAG TPA: ATP-grasp domain-containing protein [Rhizomicrobium sp.]|nr:ATP-grasp domain-containing protein [Rhizomicrobium sp.]